MDLSSKIRGTYRIEYANGCVQHKTLIRHSDYVSIIKPKEAEAYGYELNDDFDSAKAIKKELVNEFGKYWFTDKSPLWKSLLGGVMKLPSQQGGNHSVKLTKVSSIIRDEVHTRTRFAAKEMLRQVNRMKSIYGEHSFFAIASSKWSRKFVQSKRIYDHYVNEWELSLRKSATIHT